MVKGHFGDYSSQTIYSHESAVGYVQREDLFLDFHIDFIFILFFLFKKKLRKR